MAKVKGKASRKLRVGCFGVVALVVAAAAGAAGFLAWQGQRKPVGEPRYVALGSSFAAGLGLGPKASGSPVVCQRSLNGYPPQLARMLGLSLVDMSCSGATTTNILQGGQVFQGPQIAAVGSDTQLVTITTGGNDVNYVGDMTFMAARNAGGFGGWAARLMTGGPKAMPERDFAKLRADLDETIAEIRRRAPAATVVLVTYPLILPPQGTCDKLQLDAAQVDAMREVGNRLAAETAAAARAGGAILVNAHAAGADHNACSAEPWVNGMRDAQGAPFHPNAAGAKAVAELVTAELSEANRQAALGSNKR